MKILIIGGYGNFGKRLVTSLTNFTDHEIVVAGRSKKCGLAFVEYVQNAYGKHIDHVEVDVQNTDLIKLFKKLNPEVVVNAVGPYHLQSGRSEYRVARACIETKCNYVDLADDCAFVSDFPKELNSDALASGVMLVTGASSVPGLSSAVIDEFLPEFKTLDSIHYGISPGNQSERGEATVASILSYTGQPFTTLIDGSFKTVFGWQNLHRYDFGLLLGKRWMGNCNIPDLTLLPRYYPTIKTIRFQAGLEMGLLHGGLWCLSWLSRIRIVKNWARYSKILTRLSECFMAFGSDRGGMYVELWGRDIDGEMKTIAWQLVAENGVGINVPIISAELVIDRISRGELVPGAMPCIGLFNLDSFFAVARRWNIKQRRLDK